VVVDNEDVPLKQPTSRIERLLRNLANITASRHNLWQQLKVPLYRNAIYLMINQVLTGAFGLIFWVVAARLYAEDDVGLASAAVSAILLLTLLANLSLDYALVRFLPEAADDSVPLINSCITVTGLTSVALAAVFLAGLQFWSPALLFLRDKPLRGAAFVFFVAIASMFIVQDRAFIGMRSAGFALAKGTMFNVLRVALLVPLAALFGAFGMVSAWGIASTVPLVIGAVLFLPWVRPSYRPIPDISRKILGRIFRYSMTNWISVLLWSAPSYILPLMVANLVSPESNAYFYVAWSIANLLFQIPMAVSFSLFAEGSTEELQLERNTWRSLKLSFLIVIPACVLIAVAAGVVLMIYGGDYAANSANLLRVLVLSAVPMSINCTYFVIERVRMKLRNVVVMSASIAVGTLGLSWFLLPHIGIVGAGIAWLSSQTAAAVVVFFLLRRLSTVNVAEPIVKP
jgi:O-antigen/teichoic acid export membrane protein